LPSLTCSVCWHCGKYALWLKDKMIYPGVSEAPLPAVDIPDNVKQDYEEARNVVNASPRSAAALIRLSLQKLMTELGEKGKNLNEDIGHLVNNGLPKRVQKALDSVRVIGNNAVHPGEIDLRDDMPTTIMLFELVNMIVDTMITQPKKVDSLYNRIPQTAKNQIEKRDAKKGNSQ